MAYTVHNAGGDVIAGDAVLDDQMRRAADEVDGWIEDGDGTVVYETKGGDA